MDIFEVFKTRKSVRAYLEQAVEQDKIEAVVKAGNMAAGTPTVGRRYFNVISNHELLRRIAEEAKTVMKSSGIERAVKVASNPSYAPLFHAPVAIVVSVEGNLPPMQAGIASQNAAAAGENMLLAATALGLGSCYVGSPTLAFQNAEIRADAALPDGAKPVCVVLLGYAKSTAPHANYPEQPDNIKYIK